MSSPPETLEFYRAARAHALALAVASQPRRAHVIDRSYFFAERRVLADIDRVRRLAEREIDFLAAQAEERRERIEARLRDVERDVRDSLPSDGETVLRVVDPNGYAEFRRDRAQPPPISAGRVFTPFKPTEAEYRHALSLIPPDSLDEASTILAYWGALRKLARAA